MKLLYVDPNVTHLNPTATLLPALLSEHIPQTVCYGPGFVEEADLALGLERYVERHGPFDALVIGANTPVLVNDDDAIVGAVTYLRRYTAFTFPRTQLAPFFRDVRDAIGRLEIKVKLLSVLNLDYYATTKNQVDTLLEQGFGVLGPNDQFVVRLADLPAFAHQEKHFIRKAERFSDVWFDFLSAYPERVATAVHFVAPHEFFYAPLAKRSYEVSVPGVEYLLRQQAVSGLAQTHFSQPSKIYFQAYRLGNRLGLPMYSNPTLHRAYNQLFQRGLVKTRCVYTARGGFGIPIRKFFEIPAAGSLMLCSPPNGFSDLGYEAGRHYIDVAPGDLPAAVTHWLDHPEAQTIATAGQALTYRHHSMQARGEQLRLCIDAMIRGTFRGARWKASNFAR